MHCMVPRLLFQCTLMLLVAGCVASRPPAEEVRTFTSGSPPVNFTYQYLRPETSVDTSRQVLLLHRARADAKQWDGFTQHLASLGYTVLVPSLPLADTPATTLALLGDFWRAAGPSQDDPARHVVMGEVEGALLALEFASAQSSIGAAVLLSPAMKTGDLDALERMKGFDRCPVLLVAAENDTATSTAAMQLKEAAPAFCELALYPGNTRGTDLFAIRTAAMTQVTDWLELILGAKPVP